MRLTAIIFYIKNLIPKTINFFGFYIGYFCYLNEREKELVATFRDMPDESAELYFQLGKKLNQK